jgi:hypothetical protein
VKIDNKCVGICKYEMNEIRSTYILLIYSITLLRRYSHITDYYIVEFKKFGFLQNNIKKRSRPLKTKIDVSLFVQLKKRMLYKVR